MTDLSHEYPDFNQVNSKDPEKAIKHLILLLEEFKKRVVIAVNSKQDSP